MMKPPGYLGDLAHFMSVATVEQIARDYFDGDAAAASRQLRKDQAQGLVDLRVELVRPRRNPGCPITSIEPGATPPKELSQQIAYASSRRWGLSLIPTAVVCGTAKLAAFHGSSQTVLITGHASHEVALTDVFAAKRSNDPNFQWTLVTQKGARGAKVDAICGSILVELVGRYSGGTVAAKMSLAGNSTLEFW